MGRHSRTDAPIPFVLAGPKRKRSVSVNISLNDDGTYQVLAGVQDMSSRRYRFVNLPGGRYQRGNVAAVTQALIAAAHELAIDGEIREMLK